jgi:glycosyltransferase involved in cell wall biosynthesis
MKILVVTSSYPRFAGDIAGRFVFEWAIHLERLGHDLEVLTWHDSSSQSAANAQPLETHHRVVRVPYAPPGVDTLFYGAGTPENLRENPARALLAAPAALAMLGRISWSIARFRPDIIVGHWLVPSGLLVRAVGRLTGIPTFVVGHSGGVHLLDRLPRPVGRALAGFVASGPTSVSSLPLAEKLGRLANSQPAAKVLPMGFVGRGRLGRRPRGRPEATRPNRRDWLCIGRLVDIKGVDLAIEAFAQADLPGQPTLHIAGDGPERIRLERLATRLNARVEFHGFVTGEKKERLWDECSFALFTSKKLADGRHEGLPVSFLEACSRGLLPVCAPIPGLGVYLADRAIQQVESREPGVWSGRIAHVARLSEEERRDLVERQRAAVAELEWPRLIQRWESLLETACHTTGAGI